MANPVVDIARMIYEFSRFCDEDKALALGGQPYVPCPMSYELFEIAKRLDGKRYLELGCGPGRMTAVGAAAGFESAGIEINEGLAKMGQAIAEKMKPVVEYRIVQGSYYPYEYVTKKRPLGDGVTIVQPAKGTYEKLGFGFEEVDVFYGYFWPRQARHVWQMFSMLAKPTAVMVQYGKRPLTESQTLDKLCLNAKPVPVGAVTFTIITKWRNYKKAYC